MSFELPLLVSSQQKSVLGIPRPTISWEKDNSTTFLAAIERRMHIQQDDHSLYLLNVTKADSGRYTCHAVNEAGESSVSADLDVLGSALVAYGMIS